MKPPLTEDEENELFANALRKVLQQFVEPVKRPGQIIPWPANGESPSRKTRAVPKCYCRQLEAPASLAGFLLTLRRFL